MGDRVRLLQYGGEIYTETEDGEPYADLTTKIPGLMSQVKADQFLVKFYSENKSFLQQLLELGIFKETGLVFPMQHVDIPCWELTKIGKEYIEKGTLISAD